MIQRNADLGMTIQKCICDRFDLTPCERAKKQFELNYNLEYQENANVIVKKIFDKLKIKPMKCLTFTEEGMGKGNGLSPHNFLLSTGETLSIRTNKRRDKIAPRVVGQCGLKTFNKIFSDVIKVEALDKQDVKNFFYKYIHKMLPIYVDYFFLSDYTIWISDLDKMNFQIFEGKKCVNFEYEKKNFSFSRDVKSWNNSVFLKYKAANKNINIAEIQIPSGKRPPIFRFLMQGFGSIIQERKTNTETLGITAEKTICDEYSLKYPDSLKTRSNLNLKNKILPVIQETFNHSVLPIPVEYTGSLPGMRGGQSKCSYDFVLEGKKTLSLKTNTGKMICPPEVGQPGNVTCMKYFGHLCAIKEITEDSFKDMALNHVSEMMPIYIKFLFDSDYMLWIRKEKGKFVSRLFVENPFKGFYWEKVQFSFSRPSVKEWYECNTLKYKGISIGAFQVHHTRSCFKFRFNMMNLIKLADKEKINLVAYTSK